MTEVMRVRSDFSTPVYNILILELLYTYLNNQSFTVLTTLSFSIEIKDAKEYSIKNSKN